MKRRRSCYDGMCGALDCGRCGLSDEELHDYMKDEDELEPEPEPEPTTDINKGTP